MKPIRKNLIPAAEHQRVLSSCVDVPEERPAFGLPLDQVGISGKTLWITLDAPESVSRQFTATIHVDLAGHRRGIHMSRIEQAISELHGRRFAQVADYGRSLCRLVLESQQASRATVQLRGTIPRLRPTGISGRVSVDSAEISCTVFMRQQADTTHCRLAIGASLHHLTACPCTQVYNQALFRVDSDELPLATHSQRSITTLTVSTDDDDPAPTHEEIIDCLASVLHTAQDLLKRPDEAELVIAAHRQPQFAEDTVREAARAVAERLGSKLAADSGVSIDSLSLESIHIHDVRCRLDTSLADIVKFLA